MAPTVHPYAREARRVHDIAGLTEADIAKATGTAPSTARAWMAGTRKPTGERADRLIELSALVERLQRVMDSSYIPVWLRRPIKGGCPRPRRTLNGGPPAPSAALGSVLGA